MTNAERAIRFDSLAIQYVALMKRQDAERAALARLQRERHDSEARLREIGDSLSRASQDLTETLRGPVDRYATTLTGIIAAGYVWWLNDGSLCRVLIGSWPPVLRTPILDSIAPPSSGENHEQAGPFRTGDD